MRDITFGLFFFFIATAQADDADNTYCSPPTYKVMNQKIQNRGLELPLLTDREKTDPAAGRKLASEPGPYGHSELGFRYLSRIFGFEGDFGGDSQRAVETWLADRSYKNGENDSGALAAWEHWVVEPKKRLSVPRGSLNKISPNAGPEVFFADTADKADFQNCVQNDLSLRACKSFLGDREPEAGDRVYFGNPGTSAACKLVRNPYGYSARREIIAEGMMNRLRKWEEVGEKKSKPGPTKDAQ